MSVPPQLGGQRGRAIAGVGILLAVFAALIFVIASESRDGPKPAEAVGGITGTFSGAPVTGSGTWNNFQGGPCLDPKGEPRWFIGINWDAGAETNDTLLANQEVLEPLECTGTEDPAIRNWGPIACNEFGDFCSIVDDPCVTLYHAASGNTQGQDVAATTCELIAPTATPTPTFTPSPTATPTFTPSPTATPTNTPTPTPTFTPTPVVVVDCETARLAGLIGEPNDPGKVTLCHFTGSTSNPVVINEVALSSAESHETHHGDLWNCGSEADLVNPQFCSEGIGYPSP